jgi:hypothetical protein
MGMVGEIQAPLGALIVGITAPVIVERYLASPPSGAGGNG